MTINALQCGDDRTTGTTYSTRRKDGTTYTVQATPRGYILDGVTFATLTAAVTAARTAYERRRHV